MTLRDPDSPKSSCLLHPRQRHHQSDGLEAQKTWNTEDMEGQKTWGAEDLRVQRTLGYRKPKERFLTQIPQYPGRKVLSRCKGDTAEPRPGCRAGEQGQHSLSFNHVRASYGGRLVTSWQTGSREQSSSHPRGQEPHCTSSRKWPPRICSHFF